MSHEPGERWDTLDTFTEPDHYSAQTRVVVERAASPVLCGDWLASGRASCELLYGHGGDLHRAGSLSWRMAQRDAAPLPTQLAQPTGRRESAIACIYIAGPFSGADGWEIAENVHAAEKLARAVARLGAMPMTPHSIGARMAGTETQTFWLAATLEMMRRCDAVLFTDDWHASKGARGENTEAIRVGMPAFYSIAALSRWLSERGKRDGGA